jgi:hypothetical protein
MKSLQPIGVIDKSNFTGRGFANHCRADDLQLRVAVDAAADEFRELAQSGRAAWHDSAFSGEKGQLVSGRSYEAEPAILGARIVACGSRSSKISEFC